MYGQSNITLLIISLFVLSACAQNAATPKSAAAPQETPAAEEKQTTEETSGKKISEVPAEVSPEVAKLLSTSKEKVKSISYKYQGPETGTYLYKFLVKGNKIKYTLDPPYNVVDVDKDAYDTIYIDKDLKTAFAYCDSRKCTVKGKKAILNYNESYIMTPIDWLNKFESAQKYGEEQIEMRSTWILLSENNLKAWVDTFYGVPLKVQADNTYKFMQMTFNDVSEADVTPSS